jgi:hypothetical protein
VIVECNVVSKFPPQCTWFKEKTAVREDSRHTVRVEQVKDVSFEKYIFWFIDGDLCEVSYAYISKLILGLWEYPSE